MILIKEATLADLTQVVKLFEGYRNFYRKAADAEGAKHFLSQRIINKDSVIFIAQEDNSSYGFTQLYPLFSSTRMKKMWLLNDLFVSEEARGRGISKLLLNKAKELARDTDAAGVSLETEKNNHIGNILYPKEGFEVDKDHNYYFWENKI